MSLSPEFLLDRRNAAYVAGKASRPIADEAAGTFTLIGWVVLVFAVAAGLVFAYPFFQRAQMLSDGMATEGQVIAREVVKGRRGPIYRLDVSYLPPGGKGLIPRSILLVSAAVYEKQPLHSRIGLRVLPDHPERTVYEESFQASRISLMPVPFIGLMLILGLGALGYGARLRWKDARLGAGSAILEGRVSRCWGEETNSGYWVHVRYEAEAPGVGPVSGTSRAVRPDLVGKELPKAGATVAIAYRDPSTHRLL